MEQGGKCNNRPGSQDELNELGQNPYTEMNNHMFVGRNDRVFACLRLFLCVIFWDARTWMCVCISILVVNSSASL